MGSVSDAHGEHFHQEIEEFEKGYEGRWKPAILADFGVVFGGVMRGLTR